MYGQAAQAACHGIGELGERNRADIGIRHRPEGPFSSAVATPRTLFAQCFEAFFEKLLADQYRRK
jgi:hypothetical protein